ncbi:hypothetical protein UCDDA912_g03048 [Diaporthe ampelina]|uniref:Transcription factor domain-containing protein n=1 Tax=Diaporthe ampelina TaxID=1214573 RepID=A0A0G2FSM2_9PEZI|nr:hypothetical protein UCDDA912_g03048 [Diaporthe ampelina]
MKRRMSPTAAAADQGTPRRRRQPQTSCDFCRSKKLKCDPPRSTDAAAPDAVLERLQRLEAAVFGATTPAAATDVGSVAQAQPRGSRPGEAPLSEPSRVRRERSAELDYNQVAPIIDDCDLFTFRLTASGEYSSPKRSSLRCIDLPCREDALALFKEYLDNTDFHIVNLIHYPTAQTMIHNLYTQLRQGDKVSLASVAFVLSFCAASAFFWDQEFPSGFNFLSEENAAARSHAWRAAAFDLLDQSQRAALNSLDSIHASLILADLIYNMEGTSSRFRYIQSGARAAAHEMGLHLIDLPGHEDGDTSLYREMKRRAWWYLASTDWLLGAMGGPSGRTYTVNPRHMQVNYPHYITDSDPMIATYGAWAETALLHMNMRIRLGEICRQVIDALPLGSGDIDSLPYSKIAALDRLFEQLQLDIPTVISTADLDSLDTTAQTLALQRSVGTLSLNARWARLLRPLLQANNVPRQFEVFRRRCLSSTETVMDIASTILSAAVDSPGSAGASSSRMTSRRSLYRSGLIINHLFMACTVLATDPALRENAGTGESTYADAGTERRRAALANACRLLEKAGEKSGMAAAMVRRLVGVLRKHRVHGVESDGRSLRNEAASTSAALAIPDQGSVQKPQQALPMTDDHVAPTAQPSIPQGWGFDAGMMDPIGLGGIWDEFFETTPTDDGWQQLFADLDSFAGGV